MTTRERTDLFLAAACRVRALHPKGAEAMLGAVLGALSALCDAAHDEPGVISNRDLERLVLEVVRVAEAKAREGIQNLAAGREAFAE